MAPARHFICKSAGLRLFRVSAGRRLAVSALRPLVSLWPALALIALGPGLIAHARGAQAGAAPPDPAARAWTGRAAEIEEYLRTARIVRTEGTGRGVTRPVRAFFEPGGPIGSMTWKAIPPGISHGYYESYKSEIAAYEIDKLLALGMVPPRVEREVDGKHGVAVMWIDGTKSFADLGGVPRPPPAGRTPARSPRHGSSGLPPRSPGP